MLSVTVNAGSGPRVLKADSITFVTYDGSDFVYGMKTDAVLWDSGMEVYRVPVAELISVVC